MRTFTQKVAFALIALMCFLANPQAVMADDCLVVGEGTATSSWSVPVATYYRNSYSQQLYLADELEMSAGSITSIAFQYNYSTATTREISIFMANTDAEDLSSSFVTEGFEEVFSATDVTFDNTGEDYWVTIELETPFAYDGSSNLVVAVYSNYSSTQTGYSGGYRFLQTSATNMSRYWQNDTSSPNQFTITDGVATATAGTTNPAVSDYRPNIRFCYTAGGGGPTCDKPSGIAASDVTAHEATLAWADGSGVYNVEYKKASDTIWTALLTNTTENSIVLSNLVPTTAYQARVQSVCADLDTVSGWKSCNFTTMIGLPYTASLATQGDWIKASGLLENVLAGSATLTTTTSGWNFGARAGVLGANHAYVNVFGTSVKYWLISPEIPLDGGAELTFNLALTDFSYADPIEDFTAQADDKFVVLASSDNGATWAILEQWDNQGSANVYNQIATAGEEAAVDLSAFADQNVRIAFYVESTQSGGDNDIHVGNVHIDHLSPCARISDFAVSNITKTSAEFSWTANAGEAAWRFEYKKAADTEWISQDITENPYLLEGLDVYTAYEARVAAICDASDEEGISSFRKPISFKTVAGIPFLETFNGTMPNEWKRYTCWMDSLMEDPDNYALETATAGWQVGAANGAFAASDNHLYLNIDGASCHYWLVSPIVELEDNVQLTFDLALTKYSGQLQPIEPGQQDDDKFYVLYTLDGGATWEVLKYWDNNSSEEPFDNISSLADGQSVAIDLSEFAGQSIAIAFYGESSEDNGDNNIHIDNVRIDFIPDCNRPTGLIVENITDHSASFAWDEPEDGVSAWEYAVIANPSADTVPAAEAFAGHNVSELTLTIDELQENTPYAFFLRHACEGASSEYIVRNFQTMQTPAELPYEDGFEAGLSWVLSNGNFINKWILGEAVHNGEGTHALYISNDGTAHAYTNGSGGQMVVATKTFNFSEEGVYSVSFDWMNQGEGNYDILCVALIPDGEMPEAGAATGQWALPEGWTALHEGAKLSLKNTWQSSSYELNIEDAGIHTIALVWRQDNSGGTNPPAAVDNIRIARLACPTPLDLAVVEESATTNSVQLEWTPKAGENNWLIQYKKAGAAEWLYVADSVKAIPYTLSGLEASSVYDVRVAAWCDPTDSLSVSEYSNAITISTACDVITNFPYSENFDLVEGKTSGHVLPVCWDYINTVTGSSSYDYYPTVYNGSSYANSGTNSLKMLSYYNYEGEMYAILPEMDGLSALRMKFKARKYSTSTSYTYYDATFVVGVLNSAADTANFVAIDTISPASTSYEPFEVKFNTYEGTGKFIAIKMVSPDYNEYDYNGAYIDDIVIDPIPDCFEPTSVKVLSTTKTGVKFTYAAAEGDSLSYAIALPGVEPAEYIGVTADTISVEGLAGGTEYVLYLRAECATSSSVSLSATFQTKQQPIDLGSSFADDFEGANQWYFFNTDANAWVLGEAAHNGAGTHAIYVSDDGGVNNNYSKSGPGIVYATKLFNIADGSYIFSFDWRAKGEGTSTLYDYMRVALVPASAELAGGPVPTGFAPAGLPEGCIAVDNNQALNQADSWQTFTSNEIAVPAGTYYLAFAWKWDSSSGSDPAAAVDNVSITKVLCGKPGKPTIAAAGITASSAEIAWASEEGQAAWQIAMDTIASFIPDSVELISTSANPYTAEDLLAEHTYYVYVRANCGEDGFSAWSELASFKTAKACQKPDGVAVSDITDHTAVVTWNTYGQSSFRITYGIGTAFTDSVDVTGGSFTLFGLDENTTYRVKVAASCDETQWSSAKSFKTACTPIAALVENFDGITGSTSSHVLPDCWGYLNSGSSYSYLPNAYASASYANTGDNSLKFYSYASSSYADQYAILPAISGLSGLRMKFNARKYSASYDATFMVGVMTDPTDAASFEVIDTLAPKAIAYEPFSVAFDSYAGEGMYIAIKVEVPATSYRGVHIDDIVVEPIPSCLEPADLAVAAIGTDSAKLSWVSAASEWQIYLNNDTVSASENPYVLRDLTPATEYELKVRAICAEGDTSAWSGTLHFITECTVISSFPWSDDFNALASGIPVCWNNDEGTTTTDSYKWNRYANTTDTCLRFNSYTNSSNNTNILATPKFSLTEPVILSFDWKNPTGGAGFVFISKDGGVTKDTLASALTDITEWTEFEFNLSAYTGEEVVIYFKGISNYGNGDAYLYLDNIALAAVPACPKATGLHIAELKDTIVSFVWDAEEGAAWEYGLVPDTASAFAPADADFTGTASINEVAIDTLAPETAYLFFLRKVCGEDHSEVLFVHFSTTATPAAVPFADNFESDKGWDLINGTCTNAWVRGDAADCNWNNYGTSHALYISNDGGTSNAYTVTAPAMVYAAKLVDFALPGTYSVQYDWKANGESTYDYLRVALVPVSVQLAAATSVPSGFGPTGLPAGWIALDGGTKLNQSDEWANKVVSVEVDPALYYVVFAWRNDNSTGAQAPAAVDNIVIRHTDFPTGIESGAGIESNAVKFIRNDQVYIMINGAVYNVTGQKVELK